MFLKMLFATCLTHVIPCALFTVISIHTRKNYEIGNLGNEVENDREGSIVQDSEDGEIHLISRKV